MTASMHKQPEKTIIHPASFKEYSNAIRALTDLLETVTITENQELRGFLEYLPDEKKWRPIVVVSIIS